MQLLEQGGASSFRVVALNAIAGRDFSSNRDGEHHDEQSRQADHARRRALGTWFARERECRRDRHGGHTTATTAVTGDTSGAVGGVTGIVNCLLGSVTGVLGGLGLGGILCAGK
jgi:hypothetical protein